MDAKQIRFFLEIARTGSFTSAAKKLFISVPGLVKSMDKLEDELGVKLFHRSRHSIILTEEGMEQMAPAYLRQTETIRAEVIKAACDRDAQAEVCMTWGLLSFFPANFLSRFVLSHPKINLCTRNDTIEGCYARVASGKSAIALVFGAAAGSVPTENPEIAENQTNQRQQPEYRACGTAHKHGDDQQHAGEKAGGHGKGIRTVSSRKKWLFSSHIRHLPFAS